MKLSTPTKTELKMEIKRLQRALNEYRCIGWITREAYTRLSKGGNGSRGTVPMHSDFSHQASIPVYRAAED